MIIGLALIVIGAVVCDRRRRDFNFADAILVLACMVGGIGIAVVSIRGW